MLLAHVECQLASKHCDRIKDVHSSSAIQMSCKQCNDAAIRYLCAQFAHSFLFIYKAILYLYEHILLASL